MQPRARGLAVVLACLTTVGAEPAETLVPGVPRQVGLGPSGQASFTVTAPEPGILTAVTRGRGGALTLELGDLDGQELPGTSSDATPDDPPCNQMLVVAVPCADRWRLRLNNNSAEASRVTLAVGWLPFPPVAQPQAPHSRPSQALLVAPGKPVEGTLDPRRGALRQWYVVRAPGDGRLSVFTQGDATLDLALRVVTGPTFDTLVAETDDDQDGRTASEAAVFAVKAGQSYFMRVEAQAGSRGQFRLGTSFAAF